MIAQTRDKGARGRFDISCHDLLSRGRFRWWAGGGEQVDSAIWD
jgi:hypothetical protein